MHIGIIGTGSMGSALGQRWANANHQVFYGSRDPGHARNMVEMMGPNVQGGSIANAADFGEVILLAVPWSGVDDVLEEAGDLEGGVVIDCTNPFQEDTFDLAIGTTESAAEYIHYKAKNAQVVKAFNTLFANNIARVDDFGESKAPMLYCSDDNSAKSIVVQLGKDIGFRPVDCGPLRNARHLEAMAALSVSMGFELDMGTDWTWDIVKRH